MPSLLPCLRVQSRIMAPAESVDPIWYKAEHVAPLAQDERITWPASCLLPGKLPVACLERKQFPILCASARVHRRYIDQLVANERRGGKRLAEILTGDVLAGEW